MSLNQHLRDKLKTAADGSLRQRWSVFREMQHSTPPPPLLKLDLLISDWIYLAISPTSSRRKFPKSRLTSSPYCRRSRKQTYRLIQSTAARCLDQTPPTVEHVNKPLSKIVICPLFFIKVALRSCSAVFPPIITRLAQLSFVSDEFRAKFRSASVTPIPKKGGKNP